MMKTRAVIYVDKDLLINLVKDESSCVVVQAENYHLALHPFHLTNITSSIRDVLGEGVGKYNKKLSGILLGYENIKLLSQGTIVDDSFFVHLDVSANFYLFKPEVGKVLTGVISKKSADHVGCLLYTIFNVSIPKPRETDSDEWIGDTVDIGDEVPFRITFLRIDTRLPYIRGEFVSQNNDHDEIGEETKKYKKKSKRKISETIDDDAENKLSKKIKKHKKNFDLSDEELYNLNSVKKCQDDTDSNVETKTTRKKSKKTRKDSHCSLDETFNNVAIDNSIKKKKKKKHKEDSSAERLNEAHNNVFLDDSIMRKIKKEIYHEEELTKTFNDLHDDVGQKKKIKQEQFNSDSLDGFTEKKKNKKKKKQNDDNSWETLNDTLNCSAEELIKAFNDLQDDVKQKKKLKQDQFNSDFLDGFTEKKKKKKKKKKQNDDNSWETLNNSLNCSAEELTEAFNVFQDDVRQKKKIKQEQFNGDFLDGFMEKQKKKKKKKKQNDDDSWETLNDSLNCSFTENSVRKKIKKEVHTEDEGTFEISVSKRKKDKHKKHNDMITQNEIDGLNKIVDNSGKKTKNKNK